MSDLPSSQTDPVRPARGRIARWLQPAGAAADGVGGAFFRERMGHVLHLASGNAGAALLGLGSGLIAARALGVTEYGMLALIITFAQALERLISFQTWQPLIRYGAPLDRPEDAPDLLSLLKFGLVLDLAAGVAAFAIAIGLVLLGRSWFTLDDAAVELVILYATVLLFNIVGTPTALLRLGARFRLIAYGQVGLAAARFILSLAGLLLGLGLAGFVLIWAGTQILSSLVTLTLFRHELRRRGLVGLLRAPLRGVRGRFPGIWSFALSANASLTLRASANQLDTLIVGALADPAAAGLYHIAKRIGRVAETMGMQVEAVVYPDLARLWARRALAGMRHLVRQLQAWLIAGGLAAIAITALVAAPVLAALLGPEFAPVGPLLVVQLSAAMLTLAGSISRATLMAMGRQRRVLTVMIAATAGFYGAALLLVPTIGAMGASLAHLLLSAIWALGLMASAGRALRKGDAPETEPGLAAQPLSGSI